MPSAVVVRRVQDAVSRALRAAGLAAGEGVVIACSYGPDSLALADAVLALRRRLHLGGVTLCYVDHGLRAAARGEGPAVAAFAAAAGVPAEVVAVTVDRGRGGGPEEAARAARYTALEEIAQARGARWILLGHTASDQAETLVARLLRGAGVVGLAAIPPQRGVFVRPLLALERADVTAYLAARGLRPLHDASNDDPAFLRNRVRHRIMPILRAENPAADNALARASDALREMAGALDWAVDQAVERVALRRTPASVRCDAAALAALPPAVAKRLLTRLALDLEASLEASHLDGLLALCARAARGTTALSLPKLRGRREYADLVLERPRANGIQSTVRAEIDWTGEGEGGPYQVRMWQPGDRMRPKSLRGRSRKLQDLFSDRKIPAARRRQALVIVREKDGAIVWAQYIGPALDGNVQVTLTEADPAAINGGQYGKTPRKP